jgi:hypothetical protein
MGAAHYWTSLWRLVIFIGLAFFCLFLVITVINLLYDRMSTYDIWNSPVWLKCKTPLIILGVVCFLAVLLAYISFDNRRQRQAIERYAHSQGWGFAVDAADDVKSAVEKILYDLDIRMQYVRTVENGERAIYLFDCSYKQKKAGARVNDSYGTACMVQSKRFSGVAVSLEIIERDWTEVMISEKVDMGATPFAEDFLVLSKDPVSAQIIVNESVKCVLLEHQQSELYNPVSVTIGPGGVVVMTGRTSEPERLHDLIKIALRIEAAME